MTETELCSIELCNFGEASANVCEALIGLPAFDHLFDMLDTPAHLTRGST